MSPDAFAGGVFYLFIYLFIFIDHSAVHPWYWLYILDGSQQRDAYWVTTTLCNYYI